MKNRPGNMVTKYRIISMEKEADILDELKVIKNLLILQLTTSGVSKTDIRSILHVDMGRLRRLMRERKNHD